MTLLSRAVWLGACGVGVITKVVVLGDALLEGVVAGIETEVVNGTGWKECHTGKLKRVFVQGHSRASTEYAGFVEKDEPLRTTALE